MKENACPEYNVLNERECGSRTLHRNEGKCTSQTLRVPISNYTYKFVLVFNI